MISSGGGDSGRRSREPTTILTGPPRLRDLNAYTYGIEIMNDVYVMKVARFMQETWFLLRTQQRSERQPSSALLHPTFSAQKPAERTKYQISQPCIRYGMNRKQTRRQTPPPACRLAQSIHNWINSPFGGSVREAISRMPMNGPMLT